jgi:transcriptional regulator with PAS, ATPase and Fis domain
MTTFSPSTQKFYRSFRLHVNKDDKIGFDLKANSDSLSQGLAHRPQYDLVNLSLTGLAYITDFPFDLNQQLTATITIKKKSFEFEGEIVRVARYAEKAGSFVYGVKLNRISDESARLFIETLVHYFSTKRLKSELVNLMANEVELELPQMKDLMALMEGLYGELKRFEHNRGFAETLCLQSEALFPQSDIKVFRVTLDSEDELEQIIPLQSQEQKMSGMSHSFEMAKFKQTPVVDKVNHSLVVPLFSQIGILLGFLQINPAQERSTKWSENELLLAEYIGFMICSLILDCLFDTNIDTICLQQSESRRKYTLIGDSESMTQLRSYINGMKSKRDHTIISGPSGVGKELLAKIIHTEGEHGRMPYGVLDARDLLVEVSNLRHYLIGSDQSIGKLELYTGGCLIIKRIEVLSSHMIEELTQILQEKTELRVIMTTLLSREKFIHETPSSLIHFLKQGRQEFEFVELKPLKDHHEDIPYLVRHFLRQSSQEHGLIAKKVSTEIIEMLMAYDWPENYRELKLAVERLVSMNKGVNFIKRLPPTGVTLFDQYAKQRQVYQQILKRFDLNHEQQQLLLTRLHDLYNAAQSKTKAA